MDASLSSSLTVEEYTVSPATFERGNHHPSFTSRCDPLTPGRRVLGLTTRGDAIPLPVTEKHPNAHGRPDVLRSQPLVCHTRSGDLLRSHTHVTRLHTGGGGRTVPFSLFF